MKALQTEKLFWVLQTLGYFLKDQTIESGRLSQNTFQICFSTVNSHVPPPCFYVLFKFLIFSTSCQKIKGKKYINLKKSCLERFSTPPCADGRQVHRATSRCPSLRPGQTNPCPRKPVKGQVRGLRAAHGVSKMGWKWGCRVVMVRSSQIFFCINSYFKKYYIKILFILITMFFGFSFYFGPK